MRTQLRLTHSFQSLQSLFMRFMATTCPVCSFIPFATLPKLPSPNLFPTLYFCIQINMYYVRYFNFLRIQTVSRMDPTKPILDLYSDSNYNHQRSSSYRTVKPPTPNNPKYNRPPPQKEISYNELKEKYQELYHAYSQKVEKVNSYEEQLSNIRDQNQRLKQQLYRLEDKNQQLNANLLNKNVELEEAYRQLQEDIRRGNKAKKNDQVLDRLQQGLRDAITSNFNSLREATILQLKQF